MQLDWHHFLARPGIQSSSPQDLACLCRAPVLITGAGGSIRAALSLRLAALGVPLLLLDSSETALSNLRSAWLEAPHLHSPEGLASFVLGCAGDSRLLHDLFAEYAPHLVIHVAAYKHVPLLEEQPLAAIANNIFVTERLTHVAGGHGARVMLVSTDKAVEPVSVLGASKRVSEHIVLMHGGALGKRSCIERKRRGNLCTADLTRRPYYAYFCRR